MKGQAKPTKVLKKQTKMTKSGGYAPASKTKKIN
jgi:hypothetical protein